ncbi:MAG: glycosyltransferase [Acidobacteriota bacterium]
MAIRRLLLLAPARMPQVLEWARVLSQQVQTCELATFHPPRSQNIDTSLTMLQGWNGSRVLRPFRLVRSLKDILYHGRFDMILAYYLTSYGVLAAQSAPGRYVAVAAGSDIFPRRLAWIRERAASRALVRAMGGIAWTATMAQRMIDLGMSSEHLSVGPRGLDLEIFRPASEPPRSIRTLKVISTRRLRPIFRLDRLIAAIARLVQSGRPIELTLIGEGSERRKLEAMVSRLGLREHVSFLGNLQHRTIAARLQEADVLVSLSLADGLSTSVLEAMACGLFPIVSDIAANRNIVSHGVNGLLVSGEDPEEIEQALTRVLTSPDLRRSARERNIALSRRLFDIRKNTQKMLSSVERWMQDSQHVALANP